MSTSLADLTSLAALGQQQMFAAGNLVSCLPLKFGSPVVAQAGALTQGNGTVAAELPNAQDPPSVVKIALAETDNSPPAGIEMVMPAGR